MPQLTVAAEPALASLAQLLGDPPSKAEAARITQELCSSQLPSPIGCLRPAHEDLAALAGCSGHAAEEAGV